MLQVDLFASQALVLIRKFTWDTSALYSGIWTSNTLTLRYRQPGGNCLSPLSYSNRANRKMIPVLVKDRII